MQYKIEKSFIKQLKKISDKKILIKIKNVFFNIEKISDFSEINNVEKLEGFNEYFRIKFDYDYRIGVSFRNGVINFLAIGTREGFYKKFP